jgi:methionyl-tRNA formyltransferase
LKVFIVTQDEPFYLAEAVGYLLDTLPAGVEVVGAYILEASPFGKKKSFLERARDTASIFGLPFFAFYGFQFVRSKFDPRTVPAAFARHGVAAQAFSANINGPESLAHIRSLAPDVVISLASNQIFRKDLLALPPLGCLNLHTAKLPKYRGLMPLFWALSNNEPEIGVSVFKMDAGIDTGPILRQTTFPTADFTMHQLIRITKILGMRLINQALADLRDGKAQFLPNDDAEATVVRFPTRADARRFRAHGKRFF